MYITLHVYVYGMNTYKCEVPTHSKTIRWFIIRLDVILMESNEKYIVWGGRKVPENMYSNLYING